MDLSDIIHLFYTLQDQRNLQSVSSVKKYKTVTIKRKQVDKKIEFNIWS